nr:uncharacterized protein LOC113828149 [Penaeus vannamei]
MIRSLSHVNKEKFPRKCEAPSTYVDTTLGIGSCHEREAFLTHHAHKQRPSHSYTRRHSPEIPAAPRPSLPGSAGSARPHALSSAYKNPSQGLPNPQSFTSTIRFCER